MLISKKIHACTLRRWFENYFKQSHKFPDETHRQHSRMSKWMKHWKQKMRLLGYLETIEWKIEKENPIQLFELLKFNRKQKEANLFNVYFSWVSL